MRQVQCEAKSKGKVVATGDIAQYDSIEEAVDALGAEKALTLINELHKIKTLNAWRTKATTGTTIPKVLRDKLATLDEDSLVTVCAAMDIDIDELKAKLAEEAA